MSDAAVSRETLTWPAKLVRALRRCDTHSPKDVLEAIERGTMQLWKHGDTIVVTNVVNYPRMKVCNIFAAAGNFDEVWAIVDFQVEPWAKQQSCARIEGAGRRGWRKSAEERGYSLRGIEMFKELKP